MQGGGEIAGPERHDEARCRPPRGRAWLRGDMASPNKAGFNLRESSPPSRNIFCITVEEGQNKARRYSQSITIEGGYLLLAESTGHRSTGRRMNLMELLSPKDYRDWQLLLANPKVRVRVPVYFTLIRDTAKSGIGCTGNRRLSHFVESIFVNMGESYQDAKVSSPPLLDRKVGGFIVVGGWESQPQGQGSQSFRIPRRKVVGGRQDECFL